MSDVEGLAEVVDSQLYGTIVIRPEHDPNCGGNCAEYGCPVPVQDYGTLDDLRDVARAILASPWLAERVQAARADEPEMAADGIWEDQTRGQASKAAWRQLRARAAALRSQGAE